MLRWVRWVVLFIGLTALGCSSDTPEDFDIPSTTKIADDATRASLTSYSAADGTLHFQASTSVLDSLSPGDVIASATSPNAPSGYLRKVTSIEHNGAEVILHTSPAVLTEAIHRCSVTSRKMVTAADVVGFTPMPGLTMVNEVAAGLKTKGIGASGPGINFHLDHATLNVSNGGGDGMTHTTSSGSADGMGTVSAQVQLTGDIHFDPELQLELDIGARPFPYVSHFMFGAALNQSVDVQVDASLAAGYKFELQYDLRLAVIDIQIGPFPLVIVPTLEITLGVGGSASLNVSFHAAESQELFGGTEYVDGAGFHDISHSMQGPSTFDWASPPNLELDLQTYATVEFRMAVYDVAGPYVAAQVVLDANIAIPRNPVWDLSLSIVGTIGIKLREFGLTLLDFNAPIFTIGPFDIAHSPPTNPIVVINQPTAGTVVVPGQAITFDASGFDLQDGNINVSWSSDVDGPLGQGNRLVAAIPARGPGPRIITASATNHEGVTTAVTVPIVVAPRAPVVTIAAPFFFDTIYAQQPYRLAARVTDDFAGDPCTTPGWTFTWTSTVATTGALTGCTPQITFVPGSTPTPATLSVMAMDPWGGMATATTNLTISPPPPIVITLSSPAASPTITVTQISGAALPSPIALTATATDPSFPGDTLTYTWTATSLRADGTTIYAGPVTVGNGASASWQIAAASGPYDPNTFLDRNGVAQTTPGQLIRITLTVTDQHGQSAQSQVSIAYVFAPG